MVGPPAGRRDLAAGARPRRLGREGLQPWGGASTARSREVSPAADAAWPLACRGSGRSPALSAIFLRPLCLRGPGYGPPDPLCSIPRGERGKRRSERPHAHDGIPTSYASARSGPGARPLPKSAETMVKAAIPRRATPRPRRRRPPALAWRWSWGTGRASRRARLPGTPAPASSRRRREPRAARGG